MKVRILLWQIWEPRKPQKNGVLHNKQFKNGVGRVK